MSRKPSKPTSAEGFDAAWAKLAREALVQGATGRPAGEGWKSIAEFAEAQQPPIGRARAGEILMKLCELGVVERQRGRIGRSWIQFYRPKVM